jgi:hypothetical protein
MSKPTSLRNERPFKFTVNHRKLEPMLTDADRRKRKPDGKKSRPVLPTGNRAHQDD